MNKQDYLTAMHKLYREVYAAHGDKEVYSFDNGTSIIETFLAGFADAFGVEESLFRSLMPTIAKSSHALIRSGMSIDVLLLNVSLLALKESKMVSRLFPFKVLLWSLSGPLQLAPK